MEEELQPNPSDCQGFEPNIFRREKCKHCGHYWQLHRGVISEALLAPIRARRAGGASSSSAAASAASSGGGGGGLRGGLGGGGEAISAAARGKAAARRREKRAAEDRWLYGEGQASSSDDGGGDSDDGFRMFVPPALGQLRRRESAPAAAGPRIVNLIDFSECDVPIPASHRRRPAAPPPPPPPQPPLPLPASGATSAASSSSSAAWASSAEIAADGLAARASPAAAATAAAAVVGGGPPRYEHLDPLPGLPPPPPLLDLGPDPAAAVAAAAAAFAQGPAAPGFSTAAAPLEDLKASLQLSTSLLAGCLRDADREEARAVAGGLSAAAPGLAATWQTPGGGPGAAAPWQTQQEGARVMERAMAAAALAVEEANHIMQQDAAERKKMERTCAALQDEARRLSFTCRDLGKANNDMRRRLAAVESELSKKTKDLAWWEVTEEAAATVLTEAEISKWECDLRAASTRSLAKLTDRRVEIRVGSAAAAAAAAITDGTLCKICYDRPSACALLPCRHHAFCGPCARCIESSREPACPLCRTPVSGLFETFAG